MNRCLRSPRILIVATLISVFAAACGGGGSAQPTPTPTTLIEAPEATSTPAPAAETLAFLRDSDIWLIDADGSNERRLTNLGNVQALTWVSSEELDVVTGEDRSGHLLVDVSGTVTDLLFPVGGSWSPDASRYAVAVDEELIVFNRDGSQVTRLHPGPSLERCGEPPPSELRHYRLELGRPSFSSGGRELLIAVHCWLMSGAYNFYGSIYRVSLDEAVNEQLPDPENAPQLNLRGLVGPVFSPDEQRIAWAFIDGFSLCPWGRGLIVAAADGGGRHGLGDAILTAFGQRLAAAETIGGVTGFAWSPASDALVAGFQISPCDPAEPTSEPVGGLYVVLIDGSAEQLLVDGPAHSPAWSPSDRYIAYVEGASFGQETKPSTIRLFDLTTRQVTDLTKGESPAWQPQP